MTEAAKGRAAEGVPPVLDILPRPCYNTRMKTLNIGIFAHIDAGKTTLSERILLEGGVLRREGSVDSGTAATDFLAIERARGISVRDATVTFAYNDTAIDLIDTPGHADLSEETELAMAAIDAAVLVVSARDGVEAQTELLLSMLEARRLPFAVFVNKCDLEPDPSAVTAALLSRIGREVLSCNTPAALPSPTFEEDAVTALSDEALLESYLAGTLPEERLISALKQACSEGKIVPLLYGSARTGAGVRDLLLVLTSYFSFPWREDAPFSAFVYQVEHRPNLGKLAHIRLFGGTLSVRQEVENARTGNSFKAGQLKRIRGGKYEDTDLLRDGETGAVTGLSDVRAGDFLGAPPPIFYTVPEAYLRVQVTAEPDKLPALKAALEELSDEWPSLALEWVPEKRHLSVAIAGSVQAEVLKDTLFERFRLNAAIGAPSVVYRETIARPAWGFECYTMPKPCWAVVRFYLEPLPPGSGLVYESVCSEKKIAYRYQEHVRVSVPRALEQGRLGWKVTDLKVTLVDGEDHPQHTHPLDFFVATPMGIHDGLRNAGSVLLEPVLRLSLTAPEQAMGKLLSALRERRAVLDPPVVEGGAFSLEADIPAGETFGLNELAASLSGGRAAFLLKLKGYYPCPEGVGEARERVGVDPLDRSLWILHARGAYKK